jgi:hypothetical protein
MGLKPFQQPKVMGNNPLVCKINATLISENKMTVTSTVDRKTFIIYQSFIIISFRETFRAKAFFHTRAIFVEVATGTVHHELIHKNMCPSQDQEVQ